MRWLPFAFFSVTALTPSVLAQTPDWSFTTAGLPPPSVSEKWNLFEKETFAPMTLGAGAFNAALSQATDSTPLYGREVWPAYPERFGSAVGGIVSQNFFGDFLLASAFHEDTRHIRRGPAHKLWRRIAYAISRSVVARTDSGGATFNWSNVLGTAMSAALSNAYYPPASRTAAAAAVNWGAGVAGSGFRQSSAAWRPAVNALSGEPQGVGMNTDGSAPPSIADSGNNEPTKPSKPGSVGFVGSPFPGYANIRTQPGGLDGPLSGAERNLDCAARSTRLMSCGASSAGALGQCPPNW
jgi:hypothetical protein